jgi:hypothetical protein
VFINAEQGLATLVERLLIASGELEPGAASAARLQASVAGLSTAGNRGHHSAASSVTGFQLMNSRGIGSMRARNVSGNSGSFASGARRSTKDALNKVGGPAPPLACDARQPCGKQGC